jgi:hypothetical protein
MIMIMMTVAAAVAVVALAETMETDYRASQLSRP